MAADAEPLEIILHLPLLAEDKVRFVSQFLHQLESLALNFLNSLDFLSATYKLNLVLYLIVLRYL